MPVNTLDTTIVSVHPITPRVKKFLLRARGHRFDFTPGQHVSVAVPGDDRPVYRPYSPVNLPGTDTIAVAVKHYPNGTGSTWLHDREVGDVVPITPPSGNLRVHAFDRDVVFLATGTGLTPMLSMATQYLWHGETKATLLFGERTQEDLMFRDTLDLYSASHDNFSVEYVLSDEEWSGPRGYVQEHVSDVVETPSTPHFYVCGVPEMVVETKAALKHMGAPDEHVFSEGWEEGAAGE